MIKTITWILAGLILTASAAGLALGQDPGNSRKGKYLFKKSCRSCHLDGGTAVPLSPDSKTQAQWAKSFKKDKYQKLPCSAEWEKLSEAELNDIFSYLHQYAFDSPTPAKCK